MSSSVPIMKSGLAEVSETKQNRSGALVIGADYRGLGVVRSLGRRRIPVWVLKQDDELLLASTSRYTSRSLDWPPGEDAKRVEYLLDLGVRYGLEDWVLFPTGDESAALIARHHKSLAKLFRLTTPPWKVLRWGYDKRLTHRLAHDLAIDQPWTFHPRSREDVAALDCRFPVLLKPAIKERLNRLTAAKAWRVEDRRSLLARYDEACALVTPDVLMVQELIPGGGETQFSYAALCDHGRPVASVVARRLRQYPMEFGRASTYVETVSEPGIIEPSTRLLNAMDFTGLVEVEFKRDPRNGLYKLLDVNPRVWGWLTLCGRAGVDFPYLLWKLIWGEPFPEVRGHTGVRWMRMSTDFPTAVREVWKGRLSVRAYARSLRGPLESAIFASDDPLPGLLELPLIAYLAGKRAFRGSWC
jgi:predicted ATP-grasp superfamily ATP-dependent carboligase